MSIKINKNFPLIIEDYPEDYDGYPFITLIQYQNKEFLTVIDNSDEKTIKAFVLDLCGPENIEEELIINVARDWYETNYQKFPLSIEFSRRMILNDVKRLYKSFNINYISRIIGPLTSYEMLATKKIKRKKRKPVPNNFKVERKLITF